MKVFTAASGAEVVYYASVKEMPAKRYNLFQRCLLMEAGIGSDMEAVGRHFTKLHGYINAGMTEDARRESENLHFNIYSVLNGIDFRTATFACCVASISGQACNDLSDDGLERTSEAIRELDISVADIEAAADYVKKN